MHASAHPAPTETIFFQPSRHALLECTLPVCGTTATGIVLRCTHDLVTDPTHISFSLPLLQGRGQGEGKAVSVCS